MLTQEIRLFLIFILNLPLVFVDAASEFILHLQMGLLVFLDHGGV